MSKIRVRFYGEGAMGKLVESVLRSIDTVEYVEPWDLRSQEFDVLFSAAYPRRICQKMCGVARLCAVNLHTGLLPKQRGYHPLNWAIIWGDQMTGITIHKIVDAFDAGDVLVQQEVPIFETDNIRTLRERVESFVPRTVQAFFDNPHGYVAAAKKQNQAQVTYAPKRRPEDSELNLQAPPRDVYNLFRSCDPEQYPAFVIDRGVRRIVDKVTPEGEVTYREVE